MGVPAMSPLPAPLQEKLRQCDAVIVEADITQPPDNSALPSLDYPPLAQRFGPELLTKLEAYCQESQLNCALFANQPAWQIALTLQQRQAERLGLRPEFGIDYQLINLAKNYRKPLITLESTEQQLAMLTALPDEGLGLLEDSLIHWRTNARLLQRMVDWWLAGHQFSDIHQLELPSTFNSEVEQHLIVERNYEWSRQLLALPPGHYLVVVGALHLTSTTSLATLLTA